jgi:SPP1 family predicted phage head-tail adaptor
MPKFLKQRATLQARTLTPDGGGGYSESWQTFAVAWANVMPIGAGDRFAADAMQSCARHRIMLRRRDDVVPGHRLLTGARTFRVHAVLRKGPREPYITLLCEELP